MVVYISFGSNLGDREGNINRALKLIEENSKIEILKVSLLYETEPVGYKDQPWFLNGALKIETNLSPEELLVTLQGIEERLGRRRNFKDGPRTIDLDILLFNGQLIDTPKLKIPHPKMHLRNFVLVPLSEIAEGVIHPGLNKTIKELLLESPDKSRVKIWEGSQPQD